MASPVRYPPTTDGIAKAKTLNHPRWGLSTIQTDLYVQVDPDTPTAAATPTAIHTHSWAVVAIHIMDPTMSVRPNNRSGGVR